MRILMLSTLCFPRTIGGVENHILYLAKSLGQLGHHVEVVVPVVEESNARGQTDQAGYVHQTNYQGITVHEIYLKGLPLLLKKFRNQFGGHSQIGMMIAFAQKASYQLASHSISRIVLELMRDRNMQLLHQHDFSASLLTTKIVSRYYPVVLTNHTGEFLHIKERRLTRLLLRFVLNHYHAIIGPSQELADTKYFPNKSLYIPNGVETNFFLPVDEPTRVRLRNELGYKLEDFIVLCPRRWAPTKGVLYLCEAIRSVIGLIPNIVFLFAGSDYQGYPAYRKEVLDILHDLKSVGVNNFRLLGDIEAEQLKLFYQISDVVVIPSLLEATSLAALEAMSTACPVVATQVGGMPELIHDGVTGFLVKPADPEALREALMQVWFLGDRRKKMGQEARNFVLDNYQWRKIAEATLDVYEVALSRREPNYA